MSSEYKRGEHPRSRANLGKPKTKAGRFNFTLSPQSAEWLSRQPNKSAAIDNLIQEAIMESAIKKITELYTQGVEFDARCVDVSLGALHLLVKSEFLGSEYRMTMAYTELEVFWIKN